MRFHRIPCSNHSPDPFSGSNEPRTPGIVPVYMSIQGINGSIPVPAAARQAYAGGARPIKPTISSPETERGSAQIDKLVAGQVDTPINRGEGFDQVAPTGNDPSATLQLYTRPADRIDAATQVALGRSVDLNG